MQMDEIQIIQRCQEQDLTAFKMLFERYEQPLLRTALRMLGQQQDAEDAVQTTFIKLHRGIKNFRLEARFSTYLYQILMNVCIDTMRKKGRQRTFPVKEEILADDPPAEMSYKLEKALLSLPERMRACFILFAIEEVRQEEIAQVMGLTVGGVKAHIHHAKVKLRDILSQPYEGEMA